LIRQIRRAVPIIQSTLLKGAKVAEDCGFKRAVFGTRHCINPFLDHFSPVLDKAHAFFVRSQFVTIV